MNTIISIEEVYQQLEQHSSYISVVELAMILEASVSEVRQRLNELGNCVTRNEHDEWRLVGCLVQKLELSPLSASEIEERDELENTVQEAFYIAGKALKNTVQEAFYIAGKALKVLRDKKLYRETHSSFFVYVKERFDFTRRAADYLISASTVVENLKREQIVLGINVLPTKESQCREIAKLPLEQQSQAWLISVERANGKVPPAKIVKQVVIEIKGQPKMKSKKNKTDGIIRVPGIGFEYVAHLDEETYYLLKSYQERVGTATFNGAIRRLLDAEQQLDR
ncbi:hypothetical protein NIES4102_43440 (plasmid) [Chondrocystis sp. NIES-4102]|nr:hypothetical protein NIES4102_43440 [Chondrocystis sp. NIES-4102]